MASGLNPPPTSPPFDVSPYVKGPEIFRSWSWRFYDHLVQALFCNLGWSFCCFGIAWLAFHTGVMESSGHIPLWRLYGLGLLESAASVGWAYWVFQMFVGDGGKPSDIWLGIRNYLPKALGVAALSFSAAGWALYSLHFYFFLGGPHRLLNLLAAVFLVWILVFWLSACLYQWPLLFFQDPPLLKIFYKSILLCLGMAPASLGILLFSAVWTGFFLLLPFLWFLIGAVFLFSLSCVALEKNLLTYKITYGGKPLGPFLEILEAERQRGWRDVLKPWENR